ncbi:DUF6882 domain-containing protein [Psychroserpens luteolus]|uniref:DUF6882 domain-containing protein n=1 Tax=Psychroserpens luteolus TaxID=2855840 RepID=UPI001E620FBE|nr:DUF6882 domain-containing protein [Psychroserpens luteolus]MCD2259494.1 hypothetical protein [Psychroserpens luteolus]
MKNYDEFSNIEFEKLCESQNVFKSEYDLDSYSYWFYDQESELLRLYNSDEDEVFFKYVPVGTYSLKSNTWMWSWENEHSIEKSKNETLQVKSFGEIHNYQKLTKGLIECDKDECWEFVAIAKKFIKSLGAYCTDSKDLLTYKLLTHEYSETDSTAVKKMKQRTVDCGNHGFKRPAFVCQHLNLKKANGFEESFTTYRGMELDEEDDFAAWCNECEKVRVEKDGWNEESEKFAKIKLVCEECYFELKEFNKK